MKRILVFAVVCLLLVTAAYGLTWDHNKYMRNLSYVKSGNTTYDPLYRFMKETGNILEGDLGTGEVFYVDSDAVGNGSGEDWVNACTTFNAAYDKTTASRNDWIYAAPGHAESITSATGLAMDTAGVHIKGIGTGALRPTITLTTTITSCIAVSAADNSIENIVINSAVVGGVTAAITTTSAADGLILDSVEFTDSGSNTTEMLTCISLAASLDDAVIANCFFRNVAAGSSDSVISFVGPNDNVRIINNRFNFDAETSPILGVATACTNLELLYNKFYNVDTSGWAIYLHSSTTGIAEGNVAYGLLEDHTTFHGSSIAWFENYKTNSLGRSGTLFPAADD
jgi:hypothetical protein